MKIEVAPWIRDYVTDMDELYTELTLEVAEYKLDGEQCKVLESYKEVFELPDPKQAIFDFISEQIEDYHKSVQQSKEKNETRQQNTLKSLLPCTRKNKYEQEEEIDKFEKVKKGKKVLFKGEPGMGKTTVGKKIGWDWALGILKTFEIVFFVFLKLVRPEDSIENVIIQQTPILKGLGITKRKLLTFLKNFGSKCLLILDGFDECALGQNQDVLEILRGEKLFSCNILLTSRPHSTREITEYFQTVVKVNGFTEDEARKFAFKILQDGKLVDDVLNFTPAPLTDDDTKLYQCPILLSFLCLLVREKEISLSDKAISVGEIYTRMVRCLYRKFTIRKNRSFDESQFLETLKLIGKIAFRTLLSGNPLLKRSEVIKEVDEEVFDYGLLIGHEDAFRLIRDETADIFITFPHRSLQEFLGALYFILMLSSNTTIDTLFDANKDKPIFMTDPLFLDFCLWFLSKKNAYIPIDGKDASLTTLAEFCAKTFVSSCVHVEHITKLCPALDLRRAERKNDELMFAFYRRFLEKFENANTIVLNFMYPLQWILDTMIQSCRNIRHINIKDIFSYFACPRNCTIKVLSKRQVKLPECLVHLVTKDCTKFDNPASVQFFQKGESTHDLAVASIISFGRLITHLCVTSCSVREAELKLIVDAVTHGEMPKLSHLSFIKCELMTLSPFLEIEWPCLNHIKFQNCNLGKLNCESLAEAVSSNFTKLTSLALMDPEAEHFLDTIFKNGFLNLTQVSLGFYLRNCTSDIAQLVEAAESQKMPSLSKLRLLGITFGPLIDLVRTLPLESLALSNFDASSDDLTQMSSEISRLKLHELNISYCSNDEGNLSTLLTGSFPSLHTLTLRKCNLQSTDMYVLTRASVEGNLPELKYLDISLNDGRIEELFTNHCRWNDLLSLNILHAFYISKGDVDIPPNCFRSLQHLSVSDQTLCDLFRSRVCWQSLESLHVSMKNGETMSHIVKEQEQHLLPALESLCVNLGDAERSVFDLDETHKLRNVSIHDAESFGDVFWPWGCVCYNDRTYE